MSNIFNFLANPSRFKIFAEKVYPFLLIIMLFFISIGLWYSLFNSPPDYQQGETVRIMYVHVPAAWMDGIDGLFKHDNYEYIFIGVEASISRYIIQK